MRNLMLVFIVLISSTVVQADSFKVAETGLVKGYFLGATSEYINRATLNFEDGMPPEVSNAWLYNTDPVATEFNFGVHDKDAQVVLLNHVPDTNNWWYSHIPFNKDGISHMVWDQIYLADGTPAIIVRWEEGGDMDFNDNILLFTNIIAIPSN